MSGWHRSRDVVCWRQWSIIFIGGVPLQLDKNSLAVYVTAFASVQECDTIALAKFQWIYGRKEKRKVFCLCSLFILYEFVIRVYSYFLPIGCMILYLW